MGLSLPQLWRHKLPLSIQTGVSLAQRASKPTSVTSLILFLTRRGDRIKMTLIDPVLVQV